MSDLRLPRSALLVLLLPGCLVGNGDERCDPNQRLEAHACSCIEGTVPAPDGYGCVPCADNETIEGGACICADGYTRPNPGGPCVEAPEELGAACDPQGASCPERFPNCITDGAESYCSRVCQSAEDCAGGFACEPHGDERYCMSPPSGQLMACASHDDCAGFDASYCSVTSATCLVSDCSAEGGCHGDFACCDFAEYGAPSLCVPASVLDDGACPLGVPRLDEND